MTNKKKMTKRENVRAVRRLTQHPCRSSSTTKLELLGQKEEASEKKPTAQQVANEG